MSLNYVSREREVLPTKVLSNPYMRVEIEQIDHNYTLYQSLKSWKRQYNCVTGVWNGGSYLGLSPKDSRSSVDLTQNITINSEGWYHLYIRVKRGPTNNGRIRAYVDNELIDKPFNCYYNSQHWKMVDFGLVYLNTGVNPFKVNLEKNVLASTIFLYKINKHDSTNLTDYSQKLDIQSLKFTQNGVSELNTLEMPVTLKDNYFDEESPSRFIFDGYTNSITLWMGENKRTTTPMFGGYIVGLEDDEKNLTIKCCDRLLDFYRENLLMNFAINTKVKSDTNKVFPFVSKPTVYETIRHIAENVEEGINTSGLDYPYAFHWNFGSIKQFNSLSISKYTKIFDKKVGNPKPCLRLGVGKMTGAATVTLYDSVEDPYDAVEKNIISFQYMFSKKAAKYPTEINIEIDMFTEGQTSDDVITYSVPFNSKGGASNIISRITPVYDNKWHTVKIDLKNIFDNYAPSSAYYITGVRFVDNISYTQVKNRTKTSIWLDNICGYDDVINYNAMIDMEGKSPFEFMKSICEGSDCNLWVDYGNTRREDVLILKPDNDDTAPINALPSNIIDIGKVTYNLKEHNLRNIVKRMYHPTGKKKVSVTVKKKPTKYKYYKKWIVGYTKSKHKPIYNYAYYKYVNVNPNTMDGAISNSESYKRYRGWEDFENLTNVTREVDAEKNAQLFLESHAMAPQTFPLKMYGTSLLKPNQYLFIDEPRRHLTGLYQIKSLVHDYNPKRSDGMAWELDIGMGAPSKRFNLLTERMKNEIKRLNDKDKRSFYNISQAENLGISSPGAFIEG